MFVDCFRAAVAWNASLLDRQSSNTVAGTDILKAALSWSVVIVRGLSEDLFDLVSTVCKTVSVGSLADVKSRYCVTLPLVITPDSGNTESQTGYESGASSASSRSGAQEVGKCHNEYLVRLEQQLRADFVQEA